MMSLQEWALRWGIPDDALRELARSVTYSPAEDDSANATSEARVQSEVRLEAANLHVYLFRNNVGAGKLDSGNFVRFGLGNDSAPINKVLKSADLIGIRKRLIMPGDVGQYIGQFVSREVKSSDWKFSGTEKEHAQVRWATLINSQGGDAQIVTGVGSLNLTNPAV
jgi:hypothetical protein